MLVIISKVFNTGSELAETEDLLASLSGRQFCVTECAYPVTHDVGVAPTMTAL